MKGLGWLGSLSGRVFLLLLTGIGAASALTLWLAFGERERTLTQFRDTHAIERTEQLILTLDALPPQARSVFLANAPRLGMRVTLEPHPETGTDSLSPYAQAVADKLDDAFVVRSLPDDPAHCPRIPQEPGRRRLCEVFSVTLHDGTALRLTMLPPRAPIPPLHPDHAQYLALFFLILALLAFLSARMAMRPLHKLAAAATALGHDLNRPPLPLQGATELRQASAAFNAMQASLRQHVAQRTEMLAAITHDLQTPLTRLRLRLEKVSDPDLQEKLIGDLAAMQQLIKEGLELARSMDRREPMHLLDLDALAASLCQDAADAGQAVTYQGQAHVHVRGAPGALRRCLSNLLDNALKYGQEARVQVRVVKGWVSVSICDAGPGIAPDQLEKVFEPFYRLEHSRSRASGGTGLGLAIARNLARQQGGDIHLTLPAEGGLCAELRLPLSDERG